jgi:hypothetical protein
VNQMRECKECGKPLAGLGLKTNACYCCTECRKAFNNRRAQRGAELYDLFMAMRYDRALATKANTWTVMCNAARAYRDSDKTLRDGRKSWDLHETIQRLPMHYSNEGDKR